jgi:hypothetical protein
MRGDCSFCWYWCNWWPSLFILSFHDYILYLYEYVIDTNTGFITLLQQFKCICRRRLNYRHRKRLLSNGGNTDTYFVYFYFRRGHSVWISRFINTNHSISESLNYTFTAPSLSKTWSLFNDSFKYFFDNNLDQNFEQAGFFFNSYWKMVIKLMVFFLHVLLRTFQHLKAL